MNTINFQGGFAVELKDSKNIAEEWNASAQKVTENINKNVKELTESKSLQELEKNVQEDFKEIQELTKKMHEKNIHEICSKMLKKTEDLQQKIQKFHEFIENSANETKSQEVGLEEVEEDMLGETTDETNS